MNNFESCLSKLLSPFFLTVFVLFLLPFICILCLFVKLFLYLHIFFQTSISFFSPSPYSFPLPWSSTIQTFIPNLISLILFSFFLSLFLLISSIFLIFLKLILSKDKSKCHFQMILEVSFSTKRRIKRHGDDVTKCEMKRHVRRHISSFETSHGSASHNLNCRFVNCHCLSRV